MAVKDGASVAAKNGTSPGWVNEGCRDALVCGFHTYQNRLGGTQGAQNDRFRTDS